MSKANETENPSQTQKLNKNETKDLRNGDRYLREGGPFYRPWAAKSESGDLYIYCKWCGTDFLAKNTTGKSGHENTASHQKIKRELQNSKRIIKNFKTLMMKGDLSLLLRKKIKN